jgi:hypothetical protein
LRHEEFGEDENGDPYVVELGANWVCSLRTCCVDEVDWIRYMELGWVYEVCIVQINISSC